MKPEIRWHRVSRKSPCKVCGKPDWCTLSEVGHCCMRVESTTPMKNGGWLHGADGPLPRVELSKSSQKQDVIIDVASILDGFIKIRKTAYSVNHLAAMLGVNPESLRTLGCVKAPQHKTWAFPMRAGNNSYTGIRYRHENGDKWSERGGKQGLFIPQCGADSLMMICEGATDTAAALSMGYFAIGRPSCLGGIDMIQDYLKRNPIIRRAIIVSDLDDSGLRGAKTLAEHIHIPTTILVCPAKDMRTFYNSGGNRQTIDAMLSQQVWKNGAHDK